MHRHEERRLRRVRVLLAPSDIELLGRLIVEARPTVRFRLSTSTTVLREMPRAPRVIVDMADAIISPGYDLPVPDLWIGDEGMSIRLISPVVVDDEMRGGEISTLLDPSSAEHVAFADAVFEPLKRITKPHVAFLDGRTATLRVGAGAEAWWREDENRSFRDASLPSLYYRLKDSRR